MSKISEIIKQLKNEDSTDTWYEDGSYQRTYKPDNRDGWSLFVGKSPATGEANLAQLERVQAAAVTFDSLKDDFEDFIERINKANET